MITYCIKYQLDLTKLDDFKKYAELWIKLIEKYGGIHHGYFLPDSELDDKLNATFSFPEIAKAGAKETAVALFSFENIESYESYRKAVQNDPQCQEAMQLADNSKCFTSYERNFLTPLHSLKTMEVG